jgi:hypothetical protein
MYFCIFSEKELKLCRYYIQWFPVFRYCSFRVDLGEKMDFITNIFSAFGAIDFNVIFQLTFVALIMIAGPVVIFLLAFRGGDL